MSEYVKNSISKNWSNVCIITSIATCMHALKVGIIHWWQNPLTLGTATWWSPASQRALQMSLGPTNRRNEGGGEHFQRLLIQMLCKVRTYVHITCCASVDTSWQSTHYMLCKCRYFMADCQELSLMVTRWSWEMVYVNSTRTVILPFC